MNIGIDIRCLMEKELTGVGEYTNNLLRALFEIDRENQYYLFYNSHRKVSVPFFDYGNVHYAKFGWPNKVLHLCMVVFNRPRLDLMVRKCKNAKMPREAGSRYAGRKCENIDLFFFPNISFFSVKCPYIITCHDLSFEYFSEFLSLRRKLWHWVINPGRKFEGAERVVSVSENTQKDLVNCYSEILKQVQNDSGGCQHSGVAENYRVLKKDDVKMRKIKQKYHLPEKFIFFLGTKEPRKNIDSLVAAYELFVKGSGSDLKLVIAGAKGWRLTHHSPLTTHVISYIPEKDKRYFYNLAKMFVFPAHYEGFGFPVLEAMACGCPVITSNNSSLSEIAGESALLINSHDVNEIKNAIVAMADSETAEFYRRKGLERAEKFRWEKTARKFLDFLK